MDAGSSETEKNAAIAKRAPVIPVAVLLRERGAFPPALDADGKMLDPSPFRGLSPKQRRARLVGMLELMGAHGDPQAAAEALRHHRWEEEMRKGKAPQRGDLAVSGEIRVIDTLSAPAGTPVPFRGPRKTA